MADCCECVATKEYQGNRSQRNYSFDFEYYETSEIHVSVYNPDTQEWDGLTVNTDWRLVNPTTISLNEPTEEKIRIYRCTDLHPMRAVFQPGTAIKAKDLNDDFDQLRNAIEEAKCCGSDALERLDYGYDLWLNRIEVGTTDPETGIEGDLVKSNSDLTINDDVVASTKWIDNRYWDQCDETTYSNDNWFDEMDDVHVPTTRAVEQRLADLKALEGVEKVTGQMQREQKWDESVTDDDHVATTDALIERLDHYFSETNTEYPNTKWAQPGKIWIDGSTSKLYYRLENGVNWLQLDTKGDKGDPGDDSTVPGPQGPAGTIEIGNTTTGDPGTDAEVVNVGTDTAAVLEFTIPKGEKGDPGSGGEILTFEAPLKKTGTVVSLDLLTIPNAP